MCRTHAFSTGTARPESDGKFRLIYHGTVARRHGLEVALKAVRLVSGSIPNLEFLVIGEGDDLGRIKNLAEEMELGDCVRFLGTMPADQLPQAPPARGRWGGSNPV